MSTEEEDIHYPMYGARQPYLSHGVIIRGARLDDRDAILDMSRLSDIYEGRDSLPIRYQEYIEDPDRYMYLAEKDGQVVEYFNQYSIVKFVQMRTELTAHLKINILFAFTRKNITSIQTSFFETECQ